MSSLKMLDLGENLLKSLNSDSFAFISSTIEILILKLNKIQKNADFIYILKRLKFLDLSFNNISHLDLNSCPFLSLSRMDLSNNRLNLYEKWSFLEKLTFLNLSNSNATLILSLNFSINSNIEELDLSFNNLISLPYFINNLKKLKKLILKETNLTQLDSLVLLKQLEYVDLSNNKMIGQLLHFFIFSNSLRVFKISNTSLFYSYDYFERLSLFNVNHLDLSSNFLSLFKFTSDQINYLDISENNFNFLFTDNAVTVIEHFLYFYTNLVFINMTKSMSHKLSDKLFLFNSNLEYAHLSRNTLSRFPAFCKNMIDYDECQLKIVDFNSNNLQSIISVDLMYLVKLEYLDLSKNKLEFIESGSFNNLIALETLLLSYNKLYNLSVSFNYLDSLTLLDLSFNLIELVPDRFLSELLKLKVVDLSHNRIYAFGICSFDILKSLTDLHINENADQIEMKTNSFTQLGSLKNIYLSKSFLNNEKEFLLFTQLFKYLNINVTMPRNNRFYFKSLSLITTDHEYDCSLTLYFIERNIHLNLKTENHMFQYLSKCSQFSLKNKSLLNENQLVQSMNGYLVFRDVYFYLAWFLIFLIAPTGCLLGVIC